ncbi:MAG: GTPase Era [Rhodobacteraceae bacterium]|nr:MAG: GTPase Era [Paracoccaceae bacterium]
MTETRCGYTALIGEPNAGKSTLMNYFVGAKVSIVTHKVQTTRTRIRGIALEDNAQIIFVDTPGLFKTRRNLDKAMVAAAWAAMHESDVVVLLVEAHRGITKGVEMILMGLRDKVSKKQKVVLAINKIDKVKSEKLLKLTKDLNDAFDFEETFMISAVKGFGTQELRSYLAKQMPLSPWLYPEDQIADVPMRMIAAEVTREKLMLRLHQEIPYFLTVETEKWEQKRDGSVRIEQIIYVGQERHKGIVLGPKGETIKSVSMASRLELKDLVGAEVHLFLQVRARPRWENEPERFEAMGLNFADTRK